MHQGAVPPTTLQSHPPEHPAPQKASWRLQGAGHLAKAASSARLVAKELQQITDIGSSTCYVFKMPCDVAGCVHWF